MLVAESETHKWIRKPNYKPSVTVAFGYRFVVLGEPLEKVRK